MTAPVIVTGAAGLIGFAVASRLAADGRAVIGTDIVAPADDGGFAFHEADIRDGHGLYPLLKDGAAGIIHCGAVSGPMLYPQQPHTIVDINIGGTANVLEAARVHGLRRVVYCSSTSAYGDTPKGLNSVTENTPLSAVDVYGATKAAGDVLARAYNAQHGLDTVALRFSWVYGPRRRTECILRQMICDARAGEPSRFEIGDGFTRQYVHIDDAVRATLAAWDADHLPQHAYNVTGGSQLTFEDIADAVRALYPGADITNAGAATAGDLLHGRFDIDAVARDLGYTPSLDIKAGAAAYAAWLENHNF